jgi:hypothetical protein
MCGRSFGSRPYAFVRLFGSRPHLRLLVLALLHRHPDLPFVIRRQQSARVADGALVTFWARRTDVSGASTIGIWAIPALGGEPQPYLNGVAEFDWAADGSKLVDHTPGPGDPTFVRNAGEQTEDQRIFIASPGLHAHFRSGRPIGPSSTSFKATCPTRWTSGASSRAAARPSASRVTARG